MRYAKFARHVHSTSTPGSSSPTTACRLGAPSGGQRFFRPLARDQEGLFEIDGKMRAPVAHPSRRRRTRHLAAPILGAYDSRRARLRGTCGLRTHQSGEARPRRHGSRVVALTVSPMGGTRALSGGLGRRGCKRLADRGTSWSLV